MKDYTQFLTQMNNHKHNHTQGQIISKCLKTDIPENPKTSIQVVKNYLDKICPNEYESYEAIRTLRMNYIARVVCNYHKITFDEVNVLSRKREIVSIRQCINYFIKEYCKRYALVKIGELWTFAHHTKKGVKYSGHDHSTIIASVNTYRDTFETEKSVQRDHYIIDRQIQEDIKNGLIDF